MWNPKYVTVATLVGYFIVSKVIFDKVYSTIPIVVDEYYHIPQGVAYCEGNLTYWNDKITTLPGLYIVSSALISPFFTCNIYNLRFVNLIASSLNLLLLLSMLQFIYGWHTESPVKIVLQAVNLAILPPLYFFSHVYYTDTLSLTFLLAYTRLTLTSRNMTLIFIFGISSVLMRQTNIMWILMMFGHKMLDLLIRSSRVYDNRFLGKTRMIRRSIITRDIQSKKNHYGLSDLYIAMRYHLEKLFSTLYVYMTKNDFAELITHWILLLCFAFFVLINDGIVVGDKSAHQSTIHIPQLFYFLLFYGFFGLPYILAKVPSTLRLIFRNKYFVIILAISFTIIIHFNTIVHPYLLADNRHYTFYVWNRWFGKYTYAIYATTPIYIFLLFSLYDNLKDQNCISFLLPYMGCTIVVLALQGMIEVRYFLIPYIILRLRLNRPSYAIVLFEFVWYFILNAVTFYIFFTKKIYWDNFNDAQRIIW